MIQKFGPYEPIRQAGDLYFIAGQVPVDPTTEQASADFTDQMNQVVKNLGSVLKSKRLTLQHIVNVRVYLTDMTKFEQMNEIFAEHFSGIGPSRECVGVTDLPHIGGNELLQIEMSAVAQKETQ